MDYYKHYSSVPTKTSDSIKDTTVDQEKRGPGNGNASNIKHLYLNTESKLCEIWCIHGGENSYTSLGFGVKTQRNIMVETGCVFCEGVIECLDSI
jgi:hypothetical protein